MRFAQECLKGLNEVPHTLPVRSESAQTRKKGSQPHGGGDLDVQKANLTYKKQRKHGKSQTRKMTRRLLELLGKILKEIQQKNHFQSGDSRESIPDRIVSINKPYVRPIVRGKEVKNVEFGASPLIHKRLFGVDVKKIGGDTGYAGTENRNLHPFSSSSVSIQPT